MKQLSFCWVQRGLSALALLLATTSAAQTQPTAFAPAVTYATGGNGPASITVADVNGDGRPDLLTANSGSPGTVGVRLGNGNGTFQAATIYAAGGGNPNSIAVVDVNGDGRPDLLTANINASRIPSGVVGVLLGNGNGTFQAATAYSTGNNAPTSLAVADVNGDGRPDLLTAHYGGGLVGVLLGTSNGTFQAATTYAAGSGNLTSIAVADVNGDGRPDLLTTTYGSPGTAEVLLGNGNGTFQNAVSYATGGTNSYSLAVADVNGDGRPDLLTANNSTNIGTAGVLLGNGNGTFQAAATYPTGGIPSSIAVADVNGDGQLDLLAANYGNPGTAGVLLGNGNGTFQAAATYPTGGSDPYSIAVADANGDGRPDLFTANYGSNTASVLLNALAYAPTLTTISPSNITPTSATLGGTLITDGGVALAGYGVVYVAGLGTPTLSNTKVQAGTNSPAAFPSTFSVSATGLTPGTTYTARAYATNSAGTSYGSAVTFTTLANTSVVSINRTGSSLTNAGTVSYTVTFAAPVTGLTAGNFALATTGSVAGASLTSVSGGGTTYTVTVNTGTGDGTLGLNLVNAMGLSSGLSNTLPFVGEVYTLDKTPPTVTITSAMVSNGGSTSMSPVIFLLTFSEDVLTDPFALSVGATNTAITSAFVSSSRVVQLTLVPYGTGLVTLNVRANAARDYAGNSVVATTTPYTFTPLPVPVVGALSVLYQTGDLGQPTDGQVRPFLQFVNSGTMAVPYSSLTVRYWLTVENFMGQLVTPIDYAKLGTNFVSARYVQLATPRQGAFGYIEYSFAAGAGNLAAGTDSGPIYGKAYKPDYSNFDESDDWSYQTSSSFTTNDHVTLYQNGTLINGTEPPAVTATTALQVFSASRDASASTSYLSVQLQVRNNGNRPVNYSDLTVRYYFTRDGATTLVPQVDYAKLGASNLSVRYVALTTPVNGADGYLEFGFSAALGVFYPRTGTDDILIKLRKGDYSAFDQTNDYSFTGSTTLALNSRFPAYLNGSLIFGTPPAGAPARMAAPSLPANASGATIVAAASGPQALMASPNPFGEQLTLRFALPTTQAYTLAVYDGQGRLVQQVASGQAEAEQAQEVAVPTQAYAAGLYLVRLTSASGVQTLKLVKQ